MTRRLSYTSVHWGTRPDRVVRARIARGPFRPVAPLAAISYVTTKDRASTWRHEFDLVRGRRPYLLQADPAGSIEVPPAPSDAIEIGHVVDLELTSGTRLHVSHVIVVTDRAGSGIWLASPFGVPCAIELRDGKPFVTDHGIEG